MRRTIFVSNRLPVSVRTERGELRVVSSTGGLATALSKPHEMLEAVWVGWPGDVSRATAGDIAGLDRSLEAMRCVPVHLSPHEVAHYYDGFANGVLWPLLHYLVDKVHLDAEDDWEVYQAVNQKFAERVAGLVRPGDLVWVHDYQLALVPEMLRRLVPNVRIGFFLHVPFPSVDVFAVLPWRERILQGITGADLVGFHTDGYARAFQQAAEALIGARIDDEWLDIGTRRVRVAAHPIGIDVEGFERMARSEQVATEVERLLVGASGKRIVLGVDRLDYTKGIPRRLLAIEQLLDRAPELRERVFFVQVAVPTREKVEAYASLRRHVNELVGRINARHGTPISSPVKLLYRSIPMTELVALYRAADVMLVTPLRDGMNLVAKEYVASRVDERGVLVLSEFAGAAAELCEALTVNPYHLGAISGAVQQALAMSPEEQRRRMRVLRARVADCDARTWATRFLADLVACVAPPASARISAVTLRAAND
jgi:trehalose 6-phosphate synthase/phosphatase